jgi:hypothetical protein
VSANGGSNSRPPSRPSAPSAASSPPCGRTSPTSRPTATALIEPVNGAALRIGVRNHNRPATGLFRGEVNGRSRFTGVAFLIGNDDRFHESENRGVLSFLKARNKIIFIWNRATHLLPSRLLPPSGSEAIIFARATKLKKTDFSCPVHSFSCMAIPIENRAECTESRWHLIDPTMCNHHLKASLTGLAICVVTMTSGCCSHRARSWPPDSFLVMPSVTAPAPAGANEQLYSNEVFATSQPWPNAVVRQRILKLENDVDQLKRDVSKLETPPAEVTKEKTTG